MSGNTVYVIMGNDFPDGVVDDEAAAQAICKERMEAQRAQLVKEHGEGKGALYSPRIYWRAHAFELNAISQAGVS